MGVELTFKDEDMRGVVAQILRAAEGFQQGSAPVEERGNSCMTPKEETHSEGQTEASGGTSGDTSGTEDNRLVGGKTEGKARRTKAEMESDAELVELAERAGITEDKLNSVIAEHGRASAKAALEGRIRDADASGAEAPLDPVDKKEIINRLQKLIELKGQDVVEQEAPTWMGAAGVSALMGKSPAAQHEALQQLQQQIDNHRESGGSGLLD
ncbi:hypothetical protein [Polycladidibacter hongkongensis]|uniref:hypothetical protein n=1 Tax=Polycladidibacter hongkongensis TaxID=1647556 RepID=UPI000833A0E0|nr:hypothetical protein [Pseudovibrio hongkongensis]